MNGFLPAVTLGLSPLDSNGYYRDAYGTERNRIRYAVSTANVDRWLGGTGCSPFRGTAGTTEPRALTKSRGMNAVGMQMIAQAAECDSRFLFVCTAATATATCSGAGNQTLSNGGAVAVVWSLGSNASDVGRTVPADEQENLDNASDDRYFVARERRDTKDNEFDDIVLWISPSLLIARMAAAGALP